MRNFIKTLKTDMCKRVIKNIFLGTFSIATLLVVLSNCDDSFSPTIENDEFAFSIYGYLDIDADTQWVRVMPVRESILFSKDPIDAVVTLRNLQTGQEIVLRDSLFVQQIADRISEIAFWNFWTSEKIDPSTDYELTATRSDGIKSSVVISTPSEFPAPALDIDAEQEDVLIEDMTDQIADVRTYYKVYNEAKSREEIYSFGYSGKVSPRNMPGTYIARLNRSNDHDRIEGRSGLGNDAIETGQLRILQEQIAIISAGAGWINFHELDQDVIVLPDSTSNINNGIGYMVGASIKVIPYRACIEGHPVNGTLVPCETERPFWRD